MRQDFTTLECYHSDSQAEKHHLCHEVLVVIRALSPGFGIKIRLSFRQQMRFYLFTDKQTQFPILYTKILQFKGHYVVLEKKIKLNFDINNIK